MNARLAFLALFTLCIAAALGLGNAQAAKSTPDFIEKASIGGQFEIASSRIALKRSHNADVRQFAQRMIDDHTKATDQLKSTIAADPNLHTSTFSMDTKHEKMLDRLKQATDTDFDKQYVKEQVAAHKEAVSLFKDYANEGDNDALKGFARTTLPILEDHQRHIEQIKSSM